MLLKVMYKCKLRSIRATSHSLFNFGNIHSIPCYKHKKESLISKSYWNTQFTKRHKHSEARDVKDERQSDLASTTKIVHSYYDRYVFPEPPAMISNSEHEKVISKVNEIIKDPGRLFAVVTIGGHQYKVTTNDIISTVGYMPAECGTLLRLEKVGMVGGTDFTLIGRPLLKRNIVKVEATIIEKTPSVDVLIKRFMRRRRFERTYRFNSLHTILRINNIELLKDLE